MISFSKNRWLIVTVAHYVALFIVSQLNHYISPFNIHVSILGMLIAFSAFLLKFKHGFLSLIPIALYLESLSPLKYGSFLATIIIIYGLLLWMRHKIHRESVAISAVMALVANFAVHGMLSYFAAKEYGLESINVSLVFLNFLISSMVIALFTKFYFSTVLETLSFFGVRVLEEQRESR